MKPRAYVACAAALLAMMWTHAVDLKLVAEPELRVLDMRIHGNRFLEIRWNDAEAGRPQDVEVRTTYKPIVSIHDGAWRIQFEKPSNQVQSVTY